MTGIGKGEWLMDWAFLEDIGEYIPIRRTADFHFHLYFGEVFEGTAGLEDEFVDGPVLQVFLDERRGGQVSHGWSDWHTGAG